MTNQKSHQYGISVVVPQKTFRGETSINVIRSVSEISVFPLNTLIIVLEFTITGRTNPFKRLLTTRDLKKNKQNTLRTPHRVIILQPSRDKSDDRLSAP